jgi:hypothetical protein
MHRSTRHLLVAASVVLIGRGIPVPAEGEGIADSGWIILGLGTGTASISCNGCTSGWNYGGPTLLAQAGAKVTRRLGVGIGLDEWWYLPPDTTARLVKTLAALVHYYPFQRRHFYLEGGAGWSRVFVLEGRSQAEGNGLGLVTGLGYDARVRRLKLTPRASYDYGLIGDVDFPDSGPPWARRGLFVKEWRHQVLSIGLGVGI